MAADKPADDNASALLQAAQLDAVHQEELRVANAELAAVKAQLSAVTAELHDVKRKLSQAEDYAERLVETANVLVVGLDRDGRVELINQVAAHLLGYEKRQLLGQDWLTLITPPGQQLNLRELFNSARDGSSKLPRQYTNLVQTIAGELRYIEWQSSQMEREGQFAGCLAIGVDVTERKLTEEALSASEIRYRRLFESAKDGILILDAKTGRVDDVNPYMLELLGMSYEQILGKKVWELGFLKDVAASHGNFLELQQHEYIRYEDLPLETADGQQIDAEFISNVYQVNGNLVIQCNIRNITARKQAENALQLLQAELERRIIERTAELAQATEALQHETVARIRAEESQLTAVAEERTRIAREIHDTLAQGFAGIIIQLEAAEDIMANDPSTAHIHMVKARQLARDSLTDARRSMWALRPQMLEKGDLVYAISSVVENLTKDSPINIEFSHQGHRAKLPKAIADGLLRICQEALMNAGKHSQAQNIRALLVFEPGQVQLHIEDDGRGFDAASAMFLRGLGIRIMKERAANINGTFELFSQPGQGAKIVVRVPVDGTGNGEPHG